MGDQSVMVYDIIGTYFVKTFWTSLYDISVEQYEKSKTSGSMRFNSLEEYYINAVDTYTRAISKRETSQEKINKSYIAIVKDIYEETKQYIPNINTISDFIDFVVKQFIHPEYYLIMSSGKEAMFRNILKNSIGQFSIFVTTQEIDIVLNPHRKNNWEDNLRKWQKKFISILQNEKSKLTKLFMAEKHGIKIKEESDAETVPKSVAEKMNAKINTLKSQLQEKDEFIAKQAQFIEYLKTTISAKDRAFQGIISQLQSLQIIDMSGNIQLKKPKKVNVNGENQLESKQEPPSNNTIEVETQVKNNQMQDVLQPIINAEFSDDGTVESSEESMIDITPTQEEKDQKEEKEQKEQEIDNDVVLDLSESESYQDLIPDDD